MIHDICKKPLVVAKAGAADGPCDRWRDAVGSESMKIDTNGAGA
jgi:hypothetical protein